ncbi:MAG: VWA domain-containing protein [Desulfomonile tiedjei]|uniref:VWA domain-containing protein n=1 Tax=Desulfomonile tiedjei TaxID=2358 RepID=A0A9D6UZM0_9BACT|nr:VWA domain-containing protein [Desulfomonile tiedjei]
MRKSVLFSLIAAVILTIPLLASCQQTGTESKKPPLSTQAQDKPIVPEKSPWPFFAKDGQEQELADKLTAKNFILIFDGSGSMGESTCTGSSDPSVNKCDVAKKAVLEWSKSVPEDANIGFIAFHQEGWSQLNLDNRSREEFAKIVKKIRPGGGTPLGESFRLADEMLTKQGKRQLGYGEYVIVAVTDGQATDLKVLQDRVRGILAKSPIIIYTIGFCIGDDHALNQKGRTFYRTAHNPEALRQGLHEVLAEAESFDVTRFTK